MYVVHAWWYVGSIDEVRRIYKNHEYIGIGVKPRGTIRPPVCVMVAGGGGAPDIICAKYLIKYTSHMLCIDIAIFNKC